MDDIATIIHARIDPFTREIIFEKNGVASVELDGGLWAIEFKMPSSFGQDDDASVTDSNYQITINYSQNNPDIYNDLFENVGGYGWTDYISSIGLSDDGNYIVFTWIPPSEATKTRGWLYFNIRIRNRQTNGIWSTNAKKIRVNPVVQSDGDSHLTPTQIGKIDRFIDAAQGDVAGIVQEAVSEFLKGLDPSIVARDAIILASHPVGSYYWSDDDTDPSEIFGGTWVEITNVFLFAASRNSAEIGYLVGDTGGAKSRSHTITIDEMPPHHHDLKGYGATLAKGGWGWRFGMSGPEVGVGIVTDTGGGQPFTIDTMPPYLATYCWRRVA